MSPNITVALAGNPNSGKTTMFNTLTGARQRVGNYPGVTVEKREGTLKYNGSELNVVDLPGTYSLTAFSPEELVAREYLATERPQVVVNVLDSTSLERNLYLSLQFMELGIPVVLALNMMDEVRKKGRVIDTQKLSELLSVPVVETVARTGEGKKKLIAEAYDFANVKNGKWEPLEISYGPDLDPVLKEMSELIEKEEFLTENYPSRWVALKYLENDEQIIRMGREGGAIGDKLEALSEKVLKHCRKTLNMSPEAIIADYRYGYITSIVKQGVMTVQSPQARLDMSDKIDRVLTQQFFGPAIMVGILYFMFWATFAIGEIPMGWCEMFFEWLAGAAASIIPEGLVQSLVVDGIIGGVGGVMGFVPLIAVMFVMISFLEDSGYMARMAYMLDRIMRLFGLHGASVMPFIVSGGIAGGCAVPGVMAARTLRSPKEKLATILTAPFLSCGAKLPVIILIAAAFFEDSADVLFWSSIGAWCVALLVARFLRSTIIKGESTPFVMELPPYRLPTLRGVLIHTWERAWQYIKKAGTVILAISILIWAAMTFPGMPEEKSAEFASQKTQIEASYEGEELEEKLGEIDNAEIQAGLQYSVAGRIGSAMEPVTELAGFDWRTNIALLGGFAAKEVIVSSLGTAYSLGEIDAEESEGLSDKLRNDPAWNKFTAISLLIFVMLYAPCFVTVVVIARESSWKWAGFSMAFNTALAFSLAAIVYQVGTRLFM